MRIGTCVSALLLLVACGHNEAIDEVQFGITSASAVGLTSAMAMDAMKGMPGACATVTAACSTYPCQTGSVSITLGAGCPLPLGGQASGTVTVSGSWSSADQATLSHVFANTQVASQGKALAVASVTQVSAQRSGNTVTVKYSGANAVAGASGSAVAVGAADSWTVTVDGKGTADPSDDKLTVDASSASGGFGTARAATITGVTLDPSCRQNPTAGSADITEVSGLIPKITKIQFHAACDGTAEVNGSTQPLQLLP